MTRWNEPAMVKKNVLTIAALALGAVLFFWIKKGAAEVISGPGPAPFRAGLRSSPYGPRHGFPEPMYWLAAARSMAARFERAAPTLVWIVGTMEKAAGAAAQKDYSGRVRLSFPAPEGATFANIVFSAQDANEAYLEQFDRNGFQVWLQVEPANADVGTLIDLVLTRYARHPLRHRFRHRRRMAPLEPSAQHPE